MARPIGEVRLALQLAAAERPGHVRDLAARAGVGLLLAGQTVKNMARDGELAPCGKQYVAWRRGPVQVWAPASADAVRSCVPRADAALQSYLMRNWR